MATELKRIVEKRLEEKRKKEVPKFQFFFDKEPPADFVPEPGTEDAVCFFSFVEPDPLEEIEKPEIVQDQVEIDNENDDSVDEPFSAQYVDFRPTEALEAETEKRCNKQKSTPKMVMKQLGMTPQLPDIKIEVRAERGWSLQPEKYYSK
jgi:hypothetical protein